MREIFLSNFRWGAQSWCRPSCIPITVILILIVLVVLLPLLDHAGDKHPSNSTGSGNDSVVTCMDSCKISIIESIPVGLVYPNDSVSHPSTYNSWMDLIASAQTSIEIAALYWSMRRSDVYPDDSAKEVSTRIGNGIRHSERKSTSVHEDGSNLYILRKIRLCARSVNEGEKERNIFTRFPWLSNFRGNSLTRNSFRNGYQKSDDAVQSVIHLKLKKKFCFITNDIFLFLFHHHKGRMRTFWSKSQSAKSWKTYKRVSANRWALEVKKVYIVVYRVRREIEIQLEIPVPNCL